jgi:protein O-GlcNAc transferase
MRAASATAGGFRVSGAFGMLRSMDAPTTAAQRLQAAQQHLARAELDAAYEQASAAYALAPREPAILALLGQIEHARGRLGEALQRFDAALALAPADARLRANRAALRLAVGDAAGAEADARLATQQDDVGFGGWLNLGLALEVQGRAAAAVPALERALALRPDDLATQRALARSLYHSGSGHRRCRVLLEGLIARDPRDWASRLLLANSRVNDAEIDAALADFRTLLAAHDDFQQAHSTYLIALQYHPDTTPEQLLDAHRAWAAKHAPGLPRAATARVRTPGVPLRIGWISPRFSGGPMASFVLPVIEALREHDCVQTLYATHPAQGETGARFRAAAQGWREFGRESPETVAAAIRADELDVLIDLAGHAPGNRLRALSLAPAPLQVSWGDYFCTTGVPGIDVFLSDDFLSPPGSEVHFSERLVRLPGGRLCYSPLQACDAPRERDSGPVVFGCFNRASKLNDTLLQAWARILAACPDARLQLRAGSFDDAEARAFFLDRAHRCGLPRERIDLAGYTSYENVMRAYHGIDIALDPFPFSGCATSGDALWMGVPVVTRAGRTLVSRQSGALLAPLGLGDLIATTTDDYIERAVALACDAARRAGLRRALRARMLEVHDPQRFAARFLDALRALLPARDER